MQIIWQSRYASIWTLNSPDVLPNFVVVTGENGSGKTHLLEALVQSPPNAIAVDEKNEQLECRLFNSETLRPPNERESNSSLTKERELLWTELEKASQQLILRIPGLVGLNPPASAEEVLSVLDGNEDAMERLCPDPAKRESTKEAMRNFVDGSLSEIVKTVSAAFSNAEQKVRQANAGQLVTKGKAKSRVVASPHERDLAQLAAALRNEQRTLEAFFEALEVKARVPLAVISRSEFDLAFPIDFYSNPFQRSFTSWFRRYIGRLSENATATVAHATLGGVKTFLEPDEFKNKHGIPPWEFTNGLFAKAGLPFEINKPDDFNLSTPFVARITDRDTGAEIPFDRMSSGEQVIMSLAIALSYRQGADELGGLPDLLLLDEIDAFLHPTMIDFLINVIQDYLVKEKGMSVILTTHSPSTVAISPDDSIYRLRKDGLTKHLAPCSKDNAIALLTSGVPTLNITHENHRWVFVESEYDAEFYTAIFQRLRRFRGPEVAYNKMVLSFHSSGGSPGDTVSGNCELVGKHVASLRQHGNTTISGIIDWDNNNEGGNFVFVIAKARRYNLETLMLDPLVVGALMLDRNLCEPEELGLPNDFIASDLIDKTDDASRQTLADQVITKIGNGRLSSDEPMRCKYEGGYSLRLPKWFLQEQGHKLEGMYKSAFPKLQQYHNEHEFKRQVVKKVVKEFPQLLPVEFSELFDEITA